MAEFLEILAWLAVGALGARVLHQIAGIKSGRYRKGIR
jgi:hypothetical protein